MISRFSVEKAGEAVIPAEVATDEAALDNSAAPAAPAAPIAQRFVLYLFDDVHTTTADLIQARNAADRHLTESLDATTRAAIFTTSGQGNVDFTDDRAKLHEALMKLMARPTMGRGIGMPGPQLLHGGSDPEQERSNGAAGGHHGGAGHLRSATARPDNGRPAIQIAQSVSRATASRILSFGERDYAPGAYGVGKRHPPACRGPRRPEP